MTTTRRVGRGALIYGLQPILARAVSLLMLPLYTRYLTPTDYGVMSLLGSTVEIVSLLFTSGTINGVNRFYFKRSTESERGSLLSTAWLLHLALAVGGGLVMFLAAPILSAMLLKESGTITLVQLAGANIATSVLSEVPMLRLRIKERAGAYASVALLRLAMQLSLNILFVAVLEIGVMGMLLGTLITNVVLGLGLAIAMLRETGAAWDPDAKNDLVRFGRPSRITAIGSFFLNTGDRFVVAAFWPTAVVGTYGLAYQFGFGFMQFFVSPLASAWDPIRYAMGNKPRSEWEPSYLRIFNLANILYFAGLVGIVAFIGPLIRLLTTPGFFDAAALVPPIVAAYLFQAWTATFVFQLNMAERPALYARTTWISIAVVATLYLLLVPRNGGAGAAWATLVGFALRCVLTYRVAQETWPISYNWRAARLQGAGAIIAAFAASASLRLGVWQQLAAGTAIIAVYLAFLVSVAVDRVDRQRLWALLTRRGVERYNQEVWK